MFLLFLAFPLYSNLEQYNKYNYYLIETVHLSSTNNCNVNIDGAHLIKSMVFFNYLLLFIVAMIGYSSLFVTIKLAINIRLQTRRRKQRIYVFICYLRSIYNNSKSYYFHIITFTVIKILISTSS